MIIRPSPYTRYGSPNIDLLAGYPSARDIRDIWALRGPDMLPAGIARQYAEAHPDTNEANLDAVKMFAIDDLAGTLGPRFLGTTRHDVDVHCCYPGSDDAITICFAGPRMSLASANDFTQKRGFKNAR